MFAREISKGFSEITRVISFETLFKNERLKLAVFIKKFDFSYFFK